MQNAMPDNHPSVKYGKIGVLLINLGTPEAPTAAAVRVYLKEFLSDRRVVEVPPLLWQIILRGIILPFRSKRSAKAYAKIWWHGEADRGENGEGLGEGSPLRVITQRQASGLADMFADDAIIVDWAMRYGKPAIAEKIDSLRQRGCHRILFCPLYPQYAAATVASVADAVFAKLSSMRWQGGMRFLPPYYDDDSYIDILRRSILRQVCFDDKGAENYCDGLLMSFHGLPERNLHLGDPYYCHCHKTARLLGEALGLSGEGSAERQFLVFQSRFGRARWLSPYADETVAGLAARGVKRLAVICPGFAADCLETLEEVNMGLRDLFLSSGGERFEYIACLNADDLGLELLQKLVKKELLGWHELS